MHFLGIFCNIIITGCSTMSEMIREGDVRLGMSVEDFGSNMFWGADVNNEPGMESSGGSVCCTIDVSTISAW